MVLVVSAPEGENGLKEDLTWALWTIRSVARVIRGALGSLISPLIKEKLTAAFYCELSGDVTAE